MNYCKEKQGDNTQGCSVLSFIFFKENYVYVSVYVWVWVYEYRCPQSPQGIIGSPRGAVKDSYKPPETTFESSVRATCAVNLWAIFSAPRENILNRMPKTYSLKL